MNEEHFLTFSHICADHELVTGVCWAMLSELDAMRDTKGNQWRI